MLKGYLSGTRWGRWCGAMLFVAAWYGVLRVLELWFFQVAPDPGTVPRDLAANLLLAAVLYAITRSPSRFAMAMAALMTALQLTNAGKMAVLGGPVMPDDFLAMPNMFRLADGWRLAAMAAVVAVPLALLGTAVAWRSFRTWGVLGGVGVCVALFAAFPASVVRQMDATFGNVVWNQQGNFESRGLLIHLIQETARYLDRSTSAPSRGEVREALSVVRPAGGDQGLSDTEPVFPRRNLHLIVLESFWDPMLLSAAGLAMDPIDPEFRALWAATGHSRTLSPVFGGYTANAEFEILCGFPVSEDRVFFEGGLRRNVPCLPRHLGGLGYRTIASHPNSAAFWNRVNAYERIGFATYWAKPDFLLDDMNRNFLSDTSLYRQVLEKVEPLLAGDIPIFNYILTYFGHLDYPLNEQRPRLVEVSTDSRLVKDYVNTMYYKSRELMAFLKVLREKDPDSLIVLFGDHLPSLGPNFAGYTESALLYEKRSKLTDEMLLTLTAVPLVVIDGRKGPMELGDVSMFQLPSLILRLLGVERSSIMQLMAPSSAEGVVRPLPGMHFVARNGRVVVACRQDDATVSEECAPSASWMQAVKLLIRDLFAGQQFALQAFPEESARETALSRASTVPLALAGAR